jgi:hypothetical protein
MTLSQADLRSQAQAMNHYVLMLVLGIRLTTLSPPAMPIREQTMWHRTPMLVLGTYSTMLWGSQGSGASLYRKNLAIVDVVLVITHEDRPCSKESMEQDIHFLAGTQLLIGGAVIIHANSRIDEEHYRSRYCAFLLQLRSHEAF